MPLHYSRLPQHLPAIYGAIASPLRLVYSVFGPEGMSALDASLRIGHLGHTYGPLFLVLAYTLPCALVVVVANAAHRCISKQLHEHTGRPR